MILITRFRGEPTKEAGAFCLCCATGEFASVWEAAKAAMSTADAPDLNAYSFFITDEDGRELTRWQRAESTWWRVS